MAKIQLHKQEIPPAGARVRNYDPAPMSQQWDMPGKIRDSPGPIMEHRPSHFSSALDSSEAEGRHSARVLKMLELL